MPVCACEREKEKKQEEDEVSRNTQMEQKQSWHITNMENRHVQDTYGHLLWSAGISNRPLWLCKWHVSVRIRLCGGVVSWLCVCVERVCAFVK